MVLCSCGSQQSDLQSWMSHVRRGLPRGLRSRFLQEQDRIDQATYLEKHKVVKSKILLEERKVA